MTDWLEEAEKRLDSELEISNEPDKIKVQLAKHKVLRRLQSIMPKKKKYFCVFQLKITQFLFVFVPFRSSRKLWGPSSQFMTPQ